jgi:hypothetical protein
MYSECKFLYRYHANMSFSKPRILRISIIIKQNYWQSVWLTYKLNQQECETGFSHYIWHCQFPGIFLLFYDYYFAYILSFEAWKQQTKKRAHSSVGYHSENPYLHFNRDWCEMVYMTRNARAISTVLIFTSTLNCYAQQIMQVNIIAI